MPLVLWALIFMLGVCASSCSHRHYAHSSAQHDHQFKKSKTIALSFIDDAHIFESFGMMVYDEFFKYFSCRGYTLVTECPDIIFTIEIVSFTPAYKYIASDIVLLHTEQLLTLRVIMDDVHAKKREEKIFSRTILISRPQNPVFKESFERFLCRRLLVQLMPLIERYFRKYFDDSIPEKHVSL